MIILQSSINQSFQRQFNFGSAPAQVISKASLANRYKMLLNQSLIEIILYLIQVTLLLMQIIHGLSVKKLDDKI